MAVRVLVLFFAVISFALVACGGSATTTDSLPTTNNGSGNGGATPPGGGSPSPSPTASGTTIKEKATKDKLLGGIAVGTDSHLYASTPNGVDIFDQQLNLLPSPGPMQAVIRDTWPTVPKNSAPTGPTNSSGSNINALGSTPGGGSGSAFSLTAGPVPTPSSQPLVAQFDVNAQTWIKVTTGVFGDKFVSLSSPGGTSVFVIGDHFTSSGWVGFLEGIGIACVSPVFVHPLGASAIGADGLLWVATDPSLNSNAPSDMEKNPSMLFAVDPSTGTIKLSLTLPNHSHVSAIAAGDHATWFTDDGLNEVGFVPVGGTNFTLIPLPNAGTAQAPVSITRDSIGRMWFTEFDGKRVGYVVPVTEQIVVFKVTGTPIGIVGCVPGQQCPQQNVFFAETAAIGDASF